MSWPRWWCRSRMHLADGRADALARTRRWVERAVIGLGLCPFAASVQRQGRVHYVVSEASGHRELLDDLSRELERIDMTDAAQRETTLLIVPGAMREFVEFAMFIPVAERLLRDRRLDATFQVASFHPDYVFSDLEPGDPANCTNRSPYPILQLLRQASISAVMESEADARQIYDANMHRLRQLGMDGWKDLDVGPAR